MNSKRSQIEEEPLSEVPERTIPEELAEIESLLRNVFANCSDALYREVELFGSQKGLLVYIDGLVDRNQLESVVLKPLLFASPDGGKGGAGALLQERLLPAAQMRSVSSLRELVKGLLKGEVGFALQGEREALLLDMKGWEKRSIEEPVSETVIRGPREGFTENIRTNTGMLRRKIRTPRLKIESLCVGELTQTDLAVAFIEGIADELIVEEVKKRIERIVIDGVLESGYIEEFIEDVPFSPFPQVKNTERPDVVAANLLEGRVAVFVDGTPFVLIVPVTIWGALHADEDYYERFLFTSLIRWVRIVFLFIALLLPSIYVAITTFHQQMLPTNLLLSIASAREESPFPALIEALIMEVTFEALREAGVRLPKPIGQAVSIVGALVIGQAAVQAGIVSAPMVIVVSITGIASFTIPGFNLAIAIRMLRFPMIVLAGTFGLYGITLGLLAILIHTTSLRSFGVPYLTPLAPLMISNLRDVLLRAPWWAMNLRPRLVAKQNIVRVPPGQMPSPKREDRSKSKE
ncbi:spore germination protein [Tumebacillus lipolyticus]|uniref:Spore germination protein n=1 Tax=Tumebacillus lipolyticus TaxID=1280370 RepID=A0ABW4ZZS2_9BACL